MIWRTLKYLADENIDPEVIDFFVKDGYDFRNVFQEQLQSTDDRAIIQKAKVLDRIIITHDTAPLWCRRLLVPTFFKRPLPSYS